MKPEHLNDIYIKRIVSAGKISGSHGVEDKDKYFLECCEV
jgi:hypothetical protein